MGSVIDLGPAALLLFGAGFKITIVGKARCKFIRKEDSVCHGRSIIYLFISSQRPFPVFPVLAPIVRPGREFGARGRLDRLRSFQQAPERGPARMWRPRGLAWEAWRLRSIRPGLDRNCRDKSGGRPLPEQLF